MPSRHVLVELTEAEWRMVSYTAQQGEEFVRQQSHVTTAERATLSRGLAKLVTAGQEPTAELVLRLTPGELAATVSALAMLEAGEPEEHFLDESLRPSMSAIRAFERAVAKARRLYHRGVLRSAPDGK
jgi:hypothetical protein